MSGPLDRRALKRYARETFSLNLRLCLRASTAVVAVALLLTSIQYSFGHPLTYLLMDAAANPGISTGLQLTAAGAAAALRLDNAGAILAFEITWPELGTSVLENLILLLLTVPVTYGAYEHLLHLLRGVSHDTKSLFRWYADLRLVLRPMALELLLALVQWGLRLLGALPGLLLFARAGDSPLGRLAAGVTLAGLLAAYFFSCQLTPARYFLADRPDRGVLSALGAGWRAVAGRRVDYFWFSLSFLGWELLSALTYGLGDIYLLPYRALSSALYLGLAQPRQPQEDAAHV